MKKLLVLTILCITLISQSYTKANAFGEGVAGMSNILSKVSESNKDIGLILWQSKTYTDEEITILERITESEAEAGTIECKKNIVSVILNRVHSDNFPSTISKVVFEREQFESIGNRRYQRVSVTEETKQAVIEVIKDGVTTEATYFCNMNNVTSSRIRRWFREKLTFLFTDDVGHSFFIEK